MEHLNFQTLVDFLEGDLSAADRDRVRAHLDECAACGQELAAARRLLDETRGPGLAAPSPGLVRRALAAFRRRQARSARQPRPTRTAVLRFDSWTKAAPLGLRGTPQEHQLLFATEERAFDVDLQIVKDSLTDDFVLRGQVLSNRPEPGDLEGIELRLIDAGGRAWRGLADQLGRFTFSGLVPGTYTLQVILDDYDLLLEPLLVEG